MYIKDIIALVFLGIAVLAGVSLILVRKRHRQDPTWVERQKEMAEEMARREAENAELDDEFASDNYEE